MLYPSIRKTCVGFVVAVLGMGVSLGSYMPTSQDEALLEVIYPMLDELSDQEKISVRSMLEGVIERVEKGSKKYYFASVLLVNFPPTFEESERMKMILTTVFKIDVDAISSEVVVQGPEVTAGDTIGVHYIGRLEDGTLFDTSREYFAREAGAYDSRRGYTPLEFEVGAGQMIAGFDAGVVGMRVGERKTLTIAPADAYGETGSHFLAGKTLVFDVEVMEIK